MIKRIYLILFVMTLAVPIATAQMRRGWGNKTTTRVTPAANGATNAASQAADDEAVRNKLEGTWRATETFDDASVFKVLFTFSAGRDDKNGTTIHTDELYLTGGPSCLPTQGVWKRTGERSFIVADEGFCFDPFGSPIFAPVGKLSFKSAITLNRQGTAFDGAMHVEAFDVNGVSVFTTDAILHGERMQTEGP